MDPPYCLFCTVPTPGIVSPIPLKQCAAVTMPDTPLEFLARYPYEQPFPTEEVYPAPALTSAID